MNKKSISAALFAAALAVGSLPAEAVTLQQKNVFAYGITVNAANPVKPVIFYRLNGKANKATVQVYVGNTMVKEVAGTVNAENYVTLDLSDVKQAGRVSLRVAAWNAASPASPTVVVPEAANVNNDIKFYSPYAVTVNNCPDAPTFGNVLVGERYALTDAANLGTTYHSSFGANGRGGHMIYAFTPQLEGIANAQAQGRFGFNACINPRGATGEPSSTHHRLKFTDDGRLFMMAPDPVTMGLYELNPDALNAAAKAVFVGTHNNSNGYTTTSAGAFVGGCGAGLDVYGSGSNLKIAVQSSKVQPSGSGKHERVDIYNIGTAKTWSTAPSKSYDGVAGAWYFIRHCNANVSFDPDGNGVMASNNTSTPKDTDWSLIHLNASGAIDYKDWQQAVTTEFIDCCAHVWNPDRTIFAASQKNTIKFYKVTYTGGAPSFSKIGQIYDTTLGSNINALAYDYAGNLYAVGSSKEILRCYQLPAKFGGKTNTSVPAASGFAFNYTPAVANISVAAPQWKGNGQQVTISWDAINGVDGYNIYHNGAKITPVSLKTASGRVQAVVTLDMAAASASDADMAALNHFEVKAVSGSYEAAAVSASSTNAAYPAMAATRGAVVLNADGTAASLQLSWDAPANGTVTGYTLTRSNGTETTQVAALDANTTSYATDRVGTDAYTYAVTAQMAHRLNVDGSYVNTLQAAPTQALSTQNTEFAPVVASVKNRQGLNTVLVEWDIAQGKTPASYTVLRNGNAVGTVNGIKAFTDSEVPDGMHAYSVAANYDGGNARTAVEKALDAPVARNYEENKILLKTEYTASIFESRARRNDPAKAIAVGALANMAMGNGAQGRPGDLYSHASFAAGKWYLAQLTNRNVANGTNDYGQYTDASVTDGHQGAVYALDAENLEAAPVQVLTTAGSQSAFAAVDAAGNVAVRSGEGLYNTATGALQLGGNSVALDGLAALYNPATGAGRVRYASATGQLGASGTGYVFLAPDRFAGFVSAKIVNGALAAEKVVALPADMGPARNEADGSINAVANYAFGVEGTDGDAILQIAGDAYYHYRAATGTWTRVANAGSVAGGVTFTFNGESYLVFPTPAEDGAESTFTMMAATNGNFGQAMPAAATVVPSLEGAAQQWFGVVKDETANTAFIYEYVPGVRFAKYRMYCSTNYPHAAAAMSIVPVYDTQDINTASEVKAMQANVTWKRPTTGAAAGGAYTVRQYNVALNDADGNAVRSAVVPDNGNSEYSWSIKGSSDTEDNLQVGTQYTARVTAVYRLADAKADTDLSGDIEAEVAPVAQLTDYKAAIGEHAKAAGFVDNVNGLYRVDIDFNRAALAQYPEPVSYFTVEYLPNGEGSAWLPVPGLIVNYRGEKYVAPDAEAAIDAKRHNGRIWGNYTFGNGLEDRAAAPAGAPARVAGADSDKAYAMEHRDGGLATPCVAYHVTTDNPAGNVYRVTAHYAAENPFAAKTAFVETLPVESNLISTGVADIAVDNDTDAAAEYYTLGGMRVDRANLQPGIYIRVKAGVATKVSVK